MPPFLLVQPDMHFKSNFLGYKGGKTLPRFWWRHDLCLLQKHRFAGSSLKNPALEAATKSFNPDWQHHRVGNDLKVFPFFWKPEKTGWWQVGLYFGMNYAHGYNHYEDVKLGEYYRNTTDTGYFINRETNGTISETNVLWVRLPALVIKEAIKGRSGSFAHSKWRFKNRQAHSGQSWTQLFRYSAWQPGIQPAWNHQHCVEWKTCFGKANWRSTGKWVLPL